MSPRVTSVFSINRNPMLPLSASFCGSFAEPRTSVRIGVIAVGRIGDVPDRRATGSERGRRVSVSVAIEVRELGPLVLTGRRAVAPPVAGCGAGEPTPHQHLFSGPDRGLELIDA